MARIRAGMAAAPAAAGARVSDRPPRPAALVETIRRELAERWPETLERFRREFERVAGVLHRVAGPDDVAGAIACLARERDARRVVVWPPPGLGRSLAPALAAGGLDAAEMPAGEAASESERQRLRDVVAAADLGVTAVDLAVAETGSLVLLSGAGRPRSTSLLPPCHVAVFDREALVETLAQLGVFLEAWHEEPVPAGRGAVVNIITGPSRTADIELTLTRGVHGPREVHAVFVESGWRG
jgi:L-lactate dehydrogenase complex protein LldG